MSVGKSQSRAVQRDRGKRDLAAPPEALRCRERRTRRTVHSVVSVMLTPFCPSAVAPTHAYANANTHATIARTSRDRRIVLPTGHPPRNLSMEAVEAQTRNELAEGRRI